MREDWTELVQSTFEKLLKFKEYSSVINFQPDMPLQGSVGGGDLSFYFLDC